MDYKCICLFLLGAALVSAAASSYEGFPDYNLSNEYYYDDAIAEENPIPEEEDLKSIDNEADNKVNEEIQLFRDENEANINETVKEIEPLEDYQFEDNRSKDKEELEENFDEEKDDTNDENASDEDEADFHEDVDTLDANEPEDAKKIDDIPENNNKDEIAKDYALLWGDVQEQEALSKINNDEKEILEETKDILEADKEKGINFEKKIDEKVVDSKKIDEQNIPEDRNPEEIAKDYALLWGDVQEQEALAKIRDDEKKMLEETKAILEADNEKGIDFGDNVDEETQIDERLLEETRRILEENINNEDTNVFEKDNNNKVDAGGKLLEESKKILIDTDDYRINKNDEDVAEEANDQANIDEVENNLDIEGGDEADDHLVNNNENEDTAEKVYADLNADLDNLFETIEKLQDNSDENKSDYKDEMFNDALNMDPLDYEEKYGKPYREGLVLAARDDYYNSIFEDSDKSDDTAAEVLEPAENINKVKDDEDEIDDDSIETALDEEPFPDDDSLFKDALKDDKEKTISHPVEPLLYGNDAFVDDEKKDVPSDSENQSVEVNVDIENEGKVRVDKISVANLSSSELEDLTEQFAALHKDELDPQSEDFDQNVAPIHITLNLDEPVVIRSPNYPNAYPTNNIIDWVFDGEGVGIELNITDFDLNSALGDYLLVKPGGLDETGKDGIVFAYRLKSERRYRFTDVDRMFVRFESEPGINEHRGFEFSVKMISPRPEEPEPIPEPEPVVNPPTKTLTLNLGGLTLDQFREVKEPFRLVLADMASQYISDNDIEPGLNATVDITQITNTALCNIHWPEFENCVEVTFGIPLWYEDEELEPKLNEEDLETMWQTYNNRDPFALRLQRLGITEFSMPNDRSVLSVWLVIAGGVVICVAMLSVALWRFSCSENYTRMKEHTDTDSLRKEKPGLDLYPTPHQTLPPLYSENEYKWSDAKFEDSTRVDMGGFANNSYVRDDLFEFDSDEEVIAPRDSNDAKKQRDFLKNV